MCTGSNFPGKGSTSKGNKSMEDGKIIPFAKNMARDMCDNASPTDLEMQQMWEGLSSPAPEDGPPATDADASALAMQRYAPAVSEAVQDEDEYGPDDFMAPDVDMRDPA